MASMSSDLGRDGPSLMEKIRSISWPLVLLIFIAATCGIAVLYSAANGSMQPWATTQTTRFAIALVPMIGAAVVATRYWFRAAYLTYAITLALVVAVLAVWLGRPRLGAPDPAEGGPPERATPDLVDDGDHVGDRA